MPEAKAAPSLERAVRVPEFKAIRYPLRLEVVARDDLRQCPRWQVAFANQRKDHRYYELVEDTLHPEFDYRYFIIRDATGHVRAVQPFFLLAHDLLVGISPRFGALIVGIRRLWPRLMRARVLMVGCAAGEGHLDGDEAHHRAYAELLASSIAGHARTLGARLILLKEFPAQYRSALERLIDH